MKVARILFPAFGALLLFFTVQTLFQYVTFRNRADSTIGIVLGVERVSDPDGSDTMYCVNARFTTRAGRTYTTGNQESIGFLQDCWFWPILKNGETVEIYYDPHQPQRSLIKSIRPSLMMIFFFAFSLALIFIGYLGWFANEHSRSSGEKSKKGLNNAEDLSISPQRIPTPESNFVETKITSKRSLKSDFKLGISSLLLLEIFIFWIFWWEGLEFDLRIIIAALLFTVVVVFLVRSLSR